MASLAPKTQSIKARKRPSLITHPAFPAVVALWFAALFGLGTLVLPNVLFDKGVEVSGIADAIPAAAPPLGGFARTLIALAAAGIGAVLGLFLMRHVAKTVKEQGPSGPARAPSMRKQQTTINDPIDDAPRPILAHEELGDIGFGPSESALAESALPEEDAHAAIAPDADDAMEAFTGTSAAGAAIAAAMGSDEDASQNLPEEEAEEPAGEPAQEQSEAEKCLAMTKAGEETGAPDWQNETLEDLSLFHLTQRLAVSFEARKQLRAKQGKPAFSKPLTAQSGFDAALEEEAVDARAAFFDAPQTEHSDSTNASHSPKASHSPEDNAIEPAAAFAPPVAQIEPAPAKTPEPEVFTFVAANSKTLKNNDNEDALRDALKKLQGISGAA